MQKSILLLFFCLSTVFVFAGNEQYLVARFPMDINGTSIKDEVSGKSFTVENNFNRPENIPGADGNALRLDGFSTFSNAEINVGTLNSNELTVSLWCAMETYPIMDLEKVNNTGTYIAGNMRDDLKAGFAFTLNANGRYGFEIYINGAKITCYSFDNLPKYEWVHLTATVSTSQRQVLLYKNGELDAKSTFSSGLINTGENAFIIGKSFANDMSGIFRINTINGLIDEIRIYSKTLQANELDYHAPDNKADLSIPSERFENDIQRPVFHSIPGANWTNEPHGLIFHNGKYHLYYQKNANGPYWGKLHWGDLSSEDLIHWKDEKIAIAPGESYDIKGAWSGCVFSDNTLTGGKPNIFYTSVDYARASISQAKPGDEDLITWKKNSNNPIIPNRPAGLSDDFRDPYLFTFGGNSYMIVGTSKDGRGATTLHKYDSSTQTWSNDGKIFYQAASSDYGTFFEMPLIVPMEGGKWLFAATPLGGKNGVETLYWVGNINADGTFNPYSSVPKEVELGTIGCDGYGLLSPSVVQKDGKTIAIGIVPDKVSSQENKKMGWAHLFSLPREWNLDTNNNLIQKPYSGLEKIRVSENAYSATGLNLNGTTVIPNVNGKAVEITGNFTVSSAYKFGFNVRKTGNEYISVYYSPATNKISIDARNINRIWNDAGTFNGLYESVLPENIAVGENLKLHIFIDHSIMDIFINDKYAVSIRVFPTNNDANGIEIFSEGGITNVSSVNAWILDPSQSWNPSEITVVDQNNIRFYFQGDRLLYDNVPLQSYINVYDCSGRIVASQITKSFSGSLYLKQKQIYIVKISGVNFSISRKILMA